MSKQSHQRYKILYQQLASLPSWRSNNSDLRGLYSLSYIRGLTLATKRNYDLCIKVMVSSEKGLEKNSTFFWAANCGYHKIIKAHLKNGRDINSVNAYHKTALHENSDGLDTSIIPWLVKRGANVNAMDQDGWTPLHWACHSRNKQAVKDLMECGADPNLQNFGGKTARMLLEESGFCTPAQRKEIGDILESKAKQSKVPIPDLSEKVSFLKLPFQKRVSLKERIIKCYPLLWQKFIQMVHSIYLIGKRLLKII